MEYTIQKLAKMAGVSTRTLRYYDEVGILKPARINSSGYRIYGRKETDRLQQILFYRELEFSIDNIKEILSAPDFNEKLALINHKKLLLEKRRQLDQLIRNVDMTIEAKEGRRIMADNAKFEGFKRNMLDENERKYGQEIREKYGEDRVKASNEKFMNMTKEQYEEFENLGNQILDTLEAAFDTKDPAGELAREVCELHKKWLTFTWKDYSKEAHAGLAQMYVDDERFTAYYDKRKPGMAKFLRDAVLIYTELKQ
ncbi:MAG: MerR family transcriptional regulator [Clostridiales bacterium]|jgi:DNA-binding transcriptional MerR regulator|nr:MerR family transcriptional regulator [Clostridiales bacterium]